MSKPVQRRNRQPTPGERSGIIAQIEHDTKLLNYLKEDLASRIAIQAEAAISLEQATIALSQARIRFQATVAQRNSIIYGLKNLKRLFQEIELPTYIPGSPSSDMADPSKPGGPGSTHTAATAAVVVHQQDLISLLETALQEAESEVKNASEAAMISEEDFQSATNLHQARGNLISPLKGKIKEVSLMICQQREPIRSIWKVPDHIWADIFTLMVDLGTKDQQPQPSTLPVMMLDEVCYRWRNIVRSQRVLWPSDQPKTWKHIQYITIPSLKINDYSIIISRFDWLSSLHTLELCGPTVEAILPRLMSKATRRESMPKSTIPSLTKLVINQYDGDGKFICSWAEDRQLTLVGIRSWAEVEATSYTFIELGEEITQEEARTFVEQCCRRLVLGEPKINDNHTLSIAGISVVRRASKTSQWAPYKSQSPAKSVNFSDLYYEAARRFRNYNPTLWTQRQNPHVPDNPNHIIFVKIELKKCKNLKPNILSKLAPFHR